MKKSRYSSLVAFGLLLCWGIYRFLAAEGFPSGGSDAAVHFAIIEQIKRGEIFPLPYHGLIFVHLLTAVLSWILGSTTLSMLFVLDICVFFQIFCVWRASTDGVVRSLFSRILLGVLGFLCVSVALMPQMRWGFYSHGVALTLWLWTLYFIVQPIQEKKTVVRVLALGAFATLAYPLEASWMWLGLVVISFSQKHLPTYLKWIFLMLSVGVSSLLLYGLYGRMHLQGGVEDAREIYWTLLGLTIVLLVFKKLERFTPITIFVFAYFLIWGTFHFWVSRHYSVPPYYLKKGFFFAAPLLFFVGREFLARERRWIWGVFVVAGALLGALGPKMKTASLLSLWNSWAQGHAVFSRADETCLKELMEKENLGRAFIDMQPTGALAGGVGAHKFSLIAANGLSANLVITEHLELHIFKTPDDLWKIYEKTYSGRDFYLRALEEGRLRGSSWLMALEEKAFGDYQQLSCRNGRRLFWYRH
jgi:hypothetical protein